MILYDVSQAAKELGVSAITVRRKTRMGEIPHRRMGRLIRFTSQDLQDYIDRSAVPARTPAKELYRNNMTVWSCYFLIA
jgi:excisionase family DNA binding protein